MKKSSLTISFILFCVVCVAQNTANKYLADAKKALAEGHYDQAQKLAAVYNQLAGSNRGDDGDNIIKEAQAHIQYESFVKNASEQYILGQYSGALYDYVAAYSMFKEESAYLMIKKYSSISYLPLGNLSHIFFSTFASGCIELDDMRQGVQPLSSNCT